MLLQPSHWHTTWLLSCGSPVALFVNFLLIFLRVKSVAYAFASRHLSAYPLSSSSAEAQSLVSRLVPFLVSRDDKTRFPGIESATTDLFSRFNEVRLSSQTAGCLSFVS